MRPKPPPHCGGSVGPQEATAVKSIGGAGQGEEEQRPSAPAWGFPDAPAAAGQCCRVGEPRRSGVARGRGKGCGAAGSQHNDKERARSKGHDGCCTHHGCSSSSKEGGVCRGQGCCCGCCRPCCRPCCSSTTCQCSPCCTRANSAREGGAAEVEEGAGQAGGAGWGTVVGRCSSAQSAPCRQRHSQWRAAGPHCCLPGSPGRSQGKQRSAPSICHPEGGGRGRGGAGPRPGVPRGPGRCTDRSRGGGPGPWQHRGGSAPHPCHGSSRGAGAASSAAAAQWGLCGGCLCSRQPLRWGCRWPGQELFHGCL